MIRTRGNEIYLSMSHYFAYYLNMVLCEFDIFASSPYLGSHVFRPSLLPVTLVPEQQLYKIGYLKHLTPVDVQT